MKKYIVFSIIIIILLLAGVFGWFVFSKKKTISIQNATGSEQQSIDSIQNTAENIQQTENSSQQPAESMQNVENIEQETENKKELSAKQEPTATNNGEIINKLISWGFEKASGRKIDTIIVHSSYDALGNEPYDVGGLLAEYKQYGVSAHYLIDREGNAYQLVEDKNIAYHAGTSKVPDGRTGVNAFSIGIEMMNKEDGKFTDEQYASLNLLIKDLKKKYSIKYVLGHDDIAPGRKTDPWNIDWSKIDQ